MRIFSKSFRRYIYIYIYIYIYAIVCFVCVLIMYVYLFCELGLGEKRIQYLNVCLLVSVFDWYYYRKKYKKLAKEFLQFFLFLMITVKESLSIW